MQLLLKNVLLETGYEYDKDGVVVATKTALSDVLMEEGRFKKIESSIESQPHMTTIEANGQLLVPSLREMHIHIDKTYFGGEWKAPTPITEGIMTRIKEERWLLPKQLEVAEERARAVVEHYIANGHTHIRSHCNVDPQIGTKHIEITKKVLVSYADKVTYEIVAFPQHGLLRSNVEDLMREALQLGATHVGGVDPATIDRHITNSLQLTID
ncbi:MAG: deaminase, partial [Kurthia sp.]